MFVLKQINALYGKKFVQKLRKNEDEKGKGKDKSVCKQSQKFLMMKFRRPRDSKLKSLLHPQTHMHTHKRMHMHKHIHAQR